MGLRLGDGLRAVAAPGALERLLAAVADGVGSEAEKAAAIDYLLEHGLLPEPGPDPPDLRRVAAVVRTADDQRISRKKGGQRGREPGRHRKALLARARAHAEKRWREKINERAITLILDPDTCGRLIAQAPPLAITTVKAKHDDKGQITALTFTMTDGRTTTLHIPLVKKYLRDPDLSPDPAR